MSNVINFKIGRQADIDKVMEDLNQLHKDGKLTQIHVVFRDEKNANWLSSIGDWAGLCIASIMMQEHAIKKGNE